MDTRILTIFTRTPLHVGAGNSVGAIDQPIVRERHTRFPVIPGTGLKGVMADLWPCDDGGRRGGDAIWLFGAEDATAASAGALLIGEAKLLAFPVRSAKGGFAWITCPLALARFKRDSSAALDLPAPLSSEECLAAPEIALDGKVVLEEYCLTAKGESGLHASLAGLCRDAVWGTLATRFAVVSDELFAYFAEHACETATHIRIDDAKGTVAKGALFNQENVPSETLFYAVVKAQAEKGKDTAGRRPPEAAVAALTARLDEVGNVLQIGADATTGLGWCSVTLQEVK